MPTLYDTDFYSWTLQQANLLRSGSLAILDTANLIEEIESMGRSQRSELENRLIILLMHLLKWQYQPRLQSKSWGATIKGQRLDIRKLLKENPGIKPTIPTAMEWAYSRAKISASGETSLDESTFPAICPWTFDQIMNNDFWP